MRSRFRELISRVKPSSGNEQREMIEKEFLQWMGKMSKFDDVLVWGIRIK
jgi:hypothetical protein